MLRVPKIVVLRFCVSYILLVSFLDVEMYLFSYSRVFSLSVRTASVLSLSVSISQGRGTFPYCSGPARSDSKQGGEGGDRNRGKPKASLSSLLETKKRERELENKVVEETRRQGFIYTPTK